MKHRMAFLALLMAVLCFFAGCGHPAEVTEMLPTVTVLVMGGSDTEACRRISQAASELTAQELGCRVEIRMVERGDYRAAVDRMRLTGALPDIFVLDSKEWLRELQGEGELLCLDDLLTGETLLRQEITAVGEWNNVTVEGRVYGIPFNNNLPQTRAFMMRQDICDELGIDPAAITTLEQLHEALVTVQAAYPEMILVAGNYSDISPLNWWEGISYKDKVSSAVVMPFDDSGALKRITQLEEFRQWCQTMYRWQQEGLVMPELSFNQESRQELLNSGVAFGAFLRYNAAVTPLQQVNVKVPLCYAVFGTDTINYKDIACSFVMPAEAQAPETALRLLQMLYTNEELLRLCTCGQSGIDYVQEQGRYVTVGSGAGRYVTTFWCWPNNLRLFDEDVRAEVARQMEQTAPSAVEGFDFNAAGVEKELSACELVMEQYYQILVNGEIDPAQVLPEMDRQLLEAGVQRVQAEIQAQYDAWRGAQ